MIKKMMLVVFALLVSTSGFAQNAKGGFEFSPYVGLRFSDDYGTVNPDYAPVAGLRLGFFFTNSFSTEFSVQRAFAEADNVAPFNGENVNFDAVRMNFLVHFLNDFKVRPFITIGAGWERVDSDNINSQHDLGLNGGAGFRFFAGQSGGLRLEGRYVTANVDIAGTEEWQHNYEAYLGLFFLLGNKKDEKVKEEITDTDGDGVPDTLDECPNTPRGTAVDAKGCPIETFKDEDGDGVADEDDQCPGTPAGAPVDENGCPLDSDGDGVADYKDRCPDTLEGTEVDANGCPVVSKARGVLTGVVFKTNSDEIAANATTLLDGVAEELAKFPEVKVEVQGHTDSVGDVNYNLNLSQRRAESVLEYLVSRGINRDQLSAVGYGQTQPIADNGTREGREKNRRVELNWLD